MEEEEEEDIYGDYEQTTQPQNKQEDSLSDEETKHDVLAQEVEGGDSSSDEDDVNIVLEPSSTYYGGDTSTGDSKGLFVGGTTTRHWQRPGYSSTAEGGIVGSGVSAYSRGGVDLSLVPKPPTDFPGAHVDYSVFENEIDSLEEKPWREKGAELSDYFNYGFTEDTWREYCRRQQMMRLYSQSLMPIRTLDSGGPLHNIDSPNEPSRKVPRGQQNRRLTPAYSTLRNNFDSKFYSDGNESFSSDYVRYSRPEQTDGDDVILTLTKPTSVDES
ncbi:Pre-mRNA 3'-end-processing factor FIP1 [Galdieria sulphuraria]|uniref:Pre-mRNA polyadenylation factor Fip1 domain-containing protein n=1 Tax=Galdieria sulphuraria TaxID=130081 RepID=M2W1X7_GALSU|nr:uncharacterized protein Gasu_29090 [Galdieria sulphuraria]EME29686.1 hypothetical protein Gasu_29090 [Galdieria sulphuraria]GJD12160.1 Pre-mRNA 3'-end-processing factor FIP1 [Galdieria sulphuraria]|eukprot:XP_005706206.1 hypothetical protein Gasu_29090 [Galdieria sulphuraria]